MLHTPAQIKPKSFESRRNLFLFFFPGAFAPHVYVRAWKLCCFHGLISTPDFSEGTDRMPPNSKHWFTTSFLQPLPCLVTPTGPENCQLTSIYFLFIFLCSNSGKFVTNNSNKTRRIIYSHQQSLHQHK